MQYNLISPLLYFAKFVVVSFLIDELYPNISEKGVFVNLTLNQDLNSYRETYKC